jgi:hypothetical protein
VDAIPACHSCTGRNTSASDRSSMLHHPKVSLPLSLSDRATKPTRSFRSCRFEPITVLLLVGTMSVSMSANLEVEHFLILEFIPTL